jgi:hypothetical protein
MEETSPKSRADVSSASISDESGQKMKSPSLTVVSKKIAIFCAMVTIVFWILAAQIFGIFTNESQNVKRASVAIADFDGGTIGTSVLNVLAKFNRTDGYPTFVIVDTLTTTSPSEVTKDVFSGKYWAAFVVQASSTAQFEKAVNGSSTTYNVSNAVSFITFQGRYFQLFAENMLQNLEIASQTAVITISQELVPKALQSRNYTNTSASLSALAVPVIVSQVSAGPHAFTMDNKPLINTVGTVFLTLMVIFPCIASHHITTYAKVFQHQSFIRHLIYRLALSSLWSLFAALNSTGFTFAFRGSYPLTGKMFFAYWAVSWIYDIITFDIIDAILCFAPMALTPLFAVSWVIFSITATLGTPDILNTWYRINYFFPSSHWWQTVITILTQGGDNHLAYTLPTLAGWLLLGKIAVTLGVRHQLKVARSSK